MDRQEDLTKIFDRTWKANHNDVAKKGRENERKFMNKMFNTHLGEEDNKTRIITSSDRVNRLNKEMEGANYLQRQSKMNGIMKKWK